MYKMLSMYQNLYACQSWCCTGKYLTEKQILIEKQIWLFCIIVIFFLISSIHLNNKLYVHLRTARTLPRNILLPLQLKEMQICTFGGGKKSAYSSYPKNFTITPHKLSINCDRIQIHISTLNATCRDENVMVNNKCCGLPYCRGLCLWLQVEMQPSLSYCYYTWKYDSIIICNLILNFELN